VDFQMELFESRLGHCPRPCSSAALLSPRR
jgi:hypothetical protein